MESRGAVGSPYESLSCLLTGLIVVALAAGIFHPTGWWVAIAFGVAQLVLERRFFALTRSRYGVRMVLYSWPALQVYHLAIAIGFALGLLRFLTGSAQANPYDDQIIRGKGRIPQG